MHAIIINNVFQKIIDKFTFFLRNTFSRPREVTIEVTDRCNLDCPFCFNKLFAKDIKKTRELDYYCIKDIIDNISGFGIERIRFSGGEPLLREDIYDLMTYAKSKGLKIWLNTNATLIDEQKALKLSKLVDNVLIPLNSFDLFTEFLVTKNYLFESKLYGIKLLKEANIEVIRVGTVATKLNIQNLEIIHELVERLKINHWQLFRPIPAKDDLFPINNEDVAILVDKLLNINKKENKDYKIFNAIPFCAYEPEKMIKIAVGGKYDDGHTRLIIDSQGKVKPMYYLDEAIGDILISKDIKKYWNNEFMTHMRNLAFAPLACKKCKYLAICLGGSRAISKLISKTYTDFDYLAQPLKYERQLFNG